MTTEHTDLPHVCFTRSLHVPALDLTLPVYCANNGVEYIPVRHLMAWTGLGGRRAVRQLSRDNAVLYGTARLWVNPRARRSARCIRADAMWVFLLRASTAHMRRKGLHAAADRLFAKHVEWADMLHRYESFGLAVKPGQGAALRDTLQVRTVEQGLPPTIPDTASYADILLAKQIEWAQALHVYERCGLVAKPGPCNGLYELQALLHLRRAARDPEIIADIDLAIRGRSPIRTCRRMRWTASPCPRGLDICPAPAMLHPAGHIASTGLAARKLKAQRGRAVPVHRGIHAAFFALRMARFAVCGRAVREAFAPAGFLESGLLTRTVRPPACWGAVSLTLFGDVP